MKQLIKRAVNFTEPDNLPEKEKKAYELMDDVLHQLYEQEWFNIFVNVAQIEPVITEIIYQGGRGFERNYYIFINDYYHKGAGYLEIETDLEFNGKSFNVVKPDTSSHGYPASYGISVYEYDRTTGEVKYGEKLFEGII